MRSLFLFFILFALSVCVKAQVPQKINYQAVARNASGSLISNQQIGVKFTIRSGSFSGSVVYEEQTTSTTNQFGLFTSQIGTGTSTIGQFSSIAWGVGNLFIEVSIDPSGGTNFSTVSNSEFVSVPYALYSKYAENSVAGKSINWLGMFTSVPGPVDTLDAYYNLTNGISFIWNGSNWDTLAKSGGVGPIGPQGLSGINGINCWDSNGDGINDLLEDKNSDGVWDALDCIGSTGPQGPSGLDGATGATGPQGPSGADGLAGATGPQGPSGIDGATGATGPQGPSGLDGAVGATGATGIDGATGTQGPIGPTGLTGATGIDGVTGSTGPQGPSGADGLAGATGPQGPSGLD
ncbi:MAG: hypothetical protein ACK452_15140, partial [Bacteroidota bacterium]